MNILYASDENYLRHAAASMVSLCEHTPPEAELRFHLLSMGYPAKGRSGCGIPWPPMGGNSACGSWATCGSGLISR